MDSNNELKENISNKIDLKSTIEDFLRELEEKEKDLNISDEMVIEIDGDSMDDEELPEFIQAEFSADIDPVPVREIPPVRAAAIEPINNFQTENTAQKNQIAELESKIKELQSTFLRRQMDFDNYRKRIERERGTSFQNQIGNLATQMLPVLDNLNRALDLASHFEGEQSQNFQQFFDGIALVNQQLNEVLNEMGVQSISTVGEAFNPQFHDAVATEATNKFPPNTITEELLRGYRIGDKLIRAAMVKVASHAVE